MRGILLGVAAVAALSVTAVSSAVPAAAQRGNGLSFRGSGSSRLTRSDVRVHRGLGDGRRDRDGGDRDSRDGYSQGDVYFPYREYEGDTLWLSDSFNDWWHDRPDRSFPRWVGSNANCERMWWSGSGWRC